MLPYLSEWALSEKSFTATVAMYLVATVSYIIFLGWPKKTVGQMATIAVLIGVSLHFLGLVFRWIQAGINHPPFTNMYESLLFFSWGMALFYIIIELKYKVRIAGAFIFPLVLAAMGAAILNGNKEIQDLVPALQSHWLHAHVAVASLAYGAFLVSFGLSFMYLIRDEVSERSLAAALCLTIAVLLIMADKGAVLHGMFHLDRMVFIPERGYRIMPGEMINFPFVGRALAMAVLFFIASGLLNIYLTSRENAKLGEWPFVIMVAGNILLILGFIALIIQAGRTPEATLTSNPFKLAILIVASLAASGWSVLQNRFTAVKERLPDREALDNLSYVSVMVAFPLMTLVIVTGAVWAKYAWGRYWSWDPKETASLITWLIYTLYLHARLTAGWSGRRTAYISIIGFMSVLFTFLGVNILLPGLHSYGSM